MNPLEKLWRWVTLYSWECPSHWCVAPGGSCGLHVSRAGSFSQTFQEKNEAYI